MRQSTRRRSTPGVYSRCRELDGESLVRTLVQPGEEALDDVLGGQRKVLEPAQREGVQVFVGCVGRHGVVSLRVLCIPLRVLLLKALYVARVDGGVQVIGEHFIQIVNADQGGHIAEVLAAADRKFQFNQSHAG